MTQTRLNNLTELERLQLLRRQYYERYCQDISDYKQYCKEKTQNYQIMVKELDKRIEKEKMKAKSLKS